MRTSALRIAIVCGILLCTGCLVVPVPGLGTNGVRSRVVHPSDVKFIEPGKTTREDVLLRLGSPEFSTPAEDQFVYTAGYPTGFRLFLIPLCGGPAGGRAKYTVERWQRVRVEIAFDADSRVRSVRIQEEGQPWQIR